MEFFPHPKLIYYKNQNCAQLCPCNAYMSSYFSLKGFLRIFEGQLRKLFFPFYFVGCCFWIFISFHDVVAILSMIDIIFRALVRLGMFSFSQFENQKIIGFKVHFDFVLHSNIIFLTLF